MDEDPRKLMSMLMEYTVNPSSIGDLKLYLGSDIIKVDYGNG